MRGELSEKKKETKKQDNTEEEGGKIERRKAGKELNSDLSVGEPPALRERTNPQKKKKT